MDVLRHIGVAHLDGYILMGQEPQSYAGFEGVIGLAFGMIERGMQTHVRLKPRARCIAVLYV